ncbi:MAG: phage portal protein [Fluviibacter sp.]
MGLLSAMRLWDFALNVEAQAMPYVYPTSGVVPYGFNTYNIGRNAAMSVPAIARGRNTICNTVASMPLNLWNSRGEKLAKYGWMEQPDINMPKAATIAWLCDSILMYGIGYLQVTSTYAEDGRPMRMTWIDPLRVSYNTNMNGTQVTQYSIDGTYIPDSGVGSLITFSSTEEGVLARAGRTISAAIALEDAAYNMAKDPAPAVVLKNNGYDLTSDQVTSLLDTWKTARQTRSTAYLNQAVDISAFGFDPAKMQLNEARQHVATELARVMNLPAWAVDAPSGDSMTYSNNVDRRKDLIASFRGIISTIEDRLSMPDITPQGTYVRFDMDEFLRESAIERADVLTKLLAAGIITIDEARAKEGLAPTGATA